MIVEYDKIRISLKNAFTEIEIVIGLFFVLVIFVMILTVVFLSHNTELQSVDIANFKEVPDAPDVYKKGARDLIEMLIDKNERIPNDALYQAAIRVGSYSEVDYAKKWLGPIYLNLGNYSMEPYDICLTSFRDGSRKKIVGENNDNVLL